MTDTNHLCKTKRTRAMMPIKPTPEQLNTTVIVSSLVSPSAPAMKKKLEHDYIDYQIAQIRVFRFSAICRLPCLTTTKIKKNRKISEAANTVLGTLVLR